jgi:polyphosphate kinase
MPKSQPDKSKSKKQKPDLSPFGAHLPDESGNAHHLAPVKVEKVMPPKAVKEAAHDIAAFKIGKDKLPKSIKKAALESGGFPYDEKLSRKEYEDELLLLQIELLKLEQWLRKTGERIVMLFEGRDAAGKSSIIRIIMQHLNPRHARFIALPRPTEREVSQWYFQRYIAHLPSAGDMVLFDRSWYNRAGVERVMGFVEGAKVETFLREAPLFEAALVRDGVRLFKFFITIGREMQIARLHARRHDPLKQWKLSGIDLAAMDKWDDYTEARKDIFQYTHTMETPWTVIRGNDKRRARLNAIRKVLSSIPYAGKDEKVAQAPDPLIAGSGPEYFYTA